MALIALVQQSGLATEGARRFPHLLEVYTLGSHRPTRDEDQVVPLTQVGMKVTYGFAHPTFDPVPTRRTADSATHGEAISIVFELIGKNCENEQRSRPRPAALAHAFELERATQAKQASDHDGGLSLRWLFLVRNSHLPATTTPPRGEHRTSTSRVHPLAKSVLALARDALWLIRPLHDRPPSKSQKESPAERTGARGRNGFADYTF